MPLFIFYFQCSKNLDRIRKKLGWLENEKLTERTMKKCIADNECATTESCKHEKCSHILATREKYTCRRHLPKALYPQNSKSEHAVENHEICTSVGYIQQPSILKSSSSFFRCVTQIAQLQVKSSLICSISKIFCSQDL